MSLSQTNSEWSFDPRRGFTIKETRINVKGDASYFCTGTMDVINGKHVNLSAKTHWKDEEIYKFLKKHLQKELVPITDFARFTFEGMGTVQFNENRNDANRYGVLIGMELERIGEPKDPVEGTNVILICLIRKKCSINRLPEWSYEMNGKGVMRIINETDPPPGVKAIHNLEK